MQLILYLFQKYKNFLVFILLEFIALFFTIQLHSYHKSVFIDAANELSGGFYNNIISFRDYLNLEKENSQLIIENTRLQNIIARNQRIDTSFTKVVDTTFHQRYQFSNAKIISNDYHKQNNFLIINKGKNQGITSDMAVVNSKGIIGITGRTSKNYATVISILNINFKANAKFRKNDYFGTLTWDGKDPNIVQLKDVPRQANVFIGDTIITGGKSFIFPEDIMVGTVSNFVYKHNAYEQIDIRLFNDMRSIKNVEVIKDLHRSEIIKIQNSLNEQ